MIRSTHTHTRNTPHTEREAGRVFGGGLRRGGKRAAAKKHKSTLLFAKNTRCARLPPPQNTPWRAQTLSVRLSLGSRAAQAARWARWARGQARLRALATASRALTRPSSLTLTHPPAPTPHSAPQLQAAGGAGEGGERDWGRHRVVRDGGRGGRLHDQLDGDDHWAAERELGCGSVGGGGGSRGALARFWLTHTHTSTHHTPH